MEARSFGCFAPSSLLLKCYSKPVNPEELERERAQRKRAPPKGSYEGLSDAPQVSTYWFSHSVGHLVNQQTHGDHLRKDWHREGGTEQNVKQKPLRCSP